MLFPNNVKFREILLTHLYSYNIYTIHDDSSEVVLTGGEVA